MSAARVADAAAVDDAVSRFIRDEAHDRTWLYRLQLQLDVRRVSPLAVDIAAHGGLTLDDVAWRLPVPRGWPWSPLPARPRPFLKRANGAAKPRAGSSLWSQPGSRLARRGAIMRGGEDPRGQLIYLPDRDVLEVVACLGQSFLLTVGPRARLFLPGAMPETLLAAMPGMPLDRVVEHPVLSGRGYVIVEAVSDGAGGGSVLWFGTGLVPHEMPWAAALARVVERHEVTACSRPGSADVVERTCWRVARKDG